MSGDEFRFLTVPVEVTSPERVEEFLEWQSREVVQGVDTFPTFLPSWNSACGGPGAREGVGAGWTVCVAGMPGSGKSIFAVNLAAYMVRRGVSVGYISLEMTPEELEERYHAIMTGKPIAHVEFRRNFDVRRAEEITAESMMRAYESNGRLVVNYDLDDILFDVSDVIQEIETWYEMGVRAFIVDYLQLLGSGETQDVERTTALVTRALWKFARSRRVIMILLSQYNRKLSRDEKPSYHYLYGGSAIERYAHQIIHLDHTRTGDAPAGKMQWAVMDKNRHGRVFDIPILRSSESLQVREAMPDEEHKWPK